MGDEEHESKIFQKCNMCIVLYLEYIFENKIGFPHVYDLRKEKKTVESIFVKNVFVLSSR
jgi:hypothetical protein